MKKIVKKLKKYAKGMGNWVKPVDSPRRLKRFEANAFIIGVLLDQTIVAERAWSSGKWIAESLASEEDGSGLWENIEKMNERRMVGFMRYGRDGFAFHTYPAKMAGYLQGCAKVINREYQGDPRNIWNWQRSIGVVRQRLEKLPGIGSALSRMAVLILVRKYGLLGGLDSLAELDVKPDVHVMRVFRRTGLISANASREQAVETARRLSPEFPGVLDAPTWQIGRNFCRNTQPLCPSCPLNKVCPKLGV